MTITLLAPDGVAVTAQQERQARAAVHGGGSGRQLGARSGFRVGTPSNVLTATSTTWTLGPCAAVIDPGASLHQGGYGWSSDANVTGTVTAADATYARKDIVYIQVNDSSAGDGSGAISAPVQYLAGTASASPVAPSLPARSFLVGTITVPAAGGGSPTVVRNPAEYVAAGAPQPVYSLAERDALTVYDGLTVRRMDLTGDPLQWWSVTANKWLSGNVGIPYVPIWTGITDFGTGGSLTGTYWVEGDRIRVRSKAMFGAGAVLGNSVVKCPLPPGFPITGSENFHLGNGTYTPASGIGIQPLLVFQNSGSASVWIASAPVKTPGDVPVSVASGSFFEIEFSYQTSGSI